MITPGATNTIKNSARPNDTAPSPLEPVTTMPRVRRTTVNAITSTMTTAARLAWIDILGFRIKPPIAPPLRRRLTVAARKDR